MQSPKPIYYNRILSKILRQTATFTDLDVATVFRSKLVTFLTHVGRVERKLKLASKKTLSDQIFSQVDQWLQIGARNPPCKPSPKNAWMSVLYLAIVLDVKVETVDGTVGLLRERYSFSLINLKF